jgi:hypothetical protein
VSATGIARPNSGGFEAAPDGLIPLRGNWQFITGANPSVVLTAPIIYALVIPFMLLDLAVSIYQAICFPVNGIVKVRRAEYLLFDRSSLPYLNAIQKLSCFYCSYANGLLAYVEEIAARTEEHFCPIQHASIPLHLHSRYRNFVPYGDARAYFRYESNLVPAMPIQRHTIAERA